MINRIRSLCNVFSKPSHRYTKQCCNLLKSLNDAGKTVGHPKFEHLCTNVDSDLYGLVKMLAMSMLLF